MFPPLGFNCDDLGSRQSGIFERGNKDTQSLKVLGKKEMNDWVNSFDSVRV